MADDPVKKYLADIGREGGKSKSPLKLTAIKENARRPKRRFKVHSAMIDNITIISKQPFVVFGSVRGLQGEHRKLSAALSRLRKDRRGCAGVGGYSDCAIYRWDEDAGWVNAEASVNSENDD